MWWHAWEKGPPHLARQEVLAPLAWRYPSPAGTWPLLACPVWPPRTERHSKDKALCGRLHCACCPPGSWMALHGHVVLQGELSAAQSGPAGMTSGSPDLASRVQQSPTNPWLPLAASKPQRSTLAPMGVAARKAPCCSLAPELQGRRRRTSSSLWSSHSTRNNSATASCRAHTGGACLCWETRAHIPRAGHATRLHG